MTATTATTATTTPTLKPYQREGVDWLLMHPRSYLADDPGLGKTRQLLMAVYESGARRVLVVAPAMVRDAEVWPTEAAKIGVNLELTVTSYHGLAATLKAAPEGGWHAVIFDEAHRLKNRKVGWGKAAEAVAAATPRVHMASGTPVPNNATEWWAQLAILTDMPAYWTWVRKWFQVVATRWSAAQVDGTLVKCTRSCGPHCEHWAAFAAAELDGRVLRRLREDVLTDLPPISGHDTPYWVPMTRPQAKVYHQIRKDFLADLPESGETLEALTHSARFVQMLQCTTGLSTLSPDETESSKIATTLELLADRNRPTLAVVYFRSTARALVEAATEAGHRVGSIGGATSQRDREATVRAFQAGELDLLVGSVGVIKEGLTLTAADTAIVLERSWVPGDNEQVIRRIHRLGQTNPVTVYQLVTPETVDAMQWAAIGHKAEHIDSVLAPVVRRLTRASLA